MKKTIALILLTIMSCLNISGCWNYREIDKLSIVAGMAVDKSPGSNNHIVTVEIINQSAGEKETKLQSALFTAEGNSIFDAVRNLIQREARKAFWSHTNVLIVSEDIAKGGIIDILDWADRDAEVRESIWVLVSREKTAKEIFKGKTETNSIVSYHLSDMIKSEQSISKYEGVDIMEFLQGLSGGALGMVLPAVEMVENEGKKIPRINGTVIFKKDKMVGYLDGVETKAMMFVRDKIKGGLIVVNNVGDTDTNATLRIFNNKTKLNPVYKDGKITMEINVDSIMELGEIDGTADLAGKGGREKLQADAQAQVKKDIENVIRKVQKEYGTDIFKFGRTIDMKMPEVWRNIKDDWEETFREIDVDVNVSIFIRGSATTTKPIKAGD